MTDDHDWEYSYQEVRQQNVTTSRILAVRCRKCGLVRIIGMPETNLTCAEYAEQQAKFVHDQ